MDEEGHAHEKGNVALPSADLRQSNRRLLLGDLVGSSGVAEAVAALMAPGGRLHGRFEAPDAPVELVPAKVWQSYIWPVASAGAVVLRAYRVGAVDSVLAALWRNEVRSLLRVSRRNHPVLPVIRDAFALRDEGFAFLILEDPGKSLSAQPGLVRHLRAGRLDAFQMFTKLLEGLAILHEEGMVHRALTPSAVCGHLGETLSGKLDRFQMSALLGTWLRGGASENKEGASWLAAMPPDELVCLSPERLGPLLGGPRLRPEGFASDVLGLGMMAAAWLTGPPDTAACAAVVAGGKYSREAHESLLRETQERLRAAPLPRELATLLQRMIEPQPANRPPSALRVVETSRSFYGPILAQLEAEAGHDVASPFQLWFLPQTAERLYFYYQATKTHPSRIDEREYAELIVQDLEGGEICWSPDGFLPWLDREPDEVARRKAREAKVVLLGKRFAYFSQYYKNYTSGTGVADERVLVIKYPCARHVVRDFVETARRRAAPLVRARYYPPQSEPRIPQSRSWKQLLDPLRSDSTGIDRAVPVAAAEWLMGIQAGRLRAQAYDFHRVAVDANAIVLRGEWRRRPEDNTEEASEEAAFEELARRAGLVSDMGDFFNERVRPAEEAGTDAPRFVVGDTSGSDLGIKVKFGKREDAHTVRFETVDPYVVGRVPEIGRVWIDEQAQRSLLARQRRALRRLVANAALLNQLTSPRSLDLAVPRLERAGLDETTTALLERIDGAWPFFSIQGPPGTGKTFISSWVIRSMLEREPYARLLVCAQAHNALDNLLEAVCERLGDQDLLMVRVASESTRDKVSPVGTRFFPETVVKGLRDRAQRAPQTDDRALAAIVAEFRARAGDQKLDTEFKARLTLSAAVVFATCAGAGSQEIDADAIFDFVVVEEAARGWLTEVLVPLVRGERWLLVGDQRQLPAYEALELRRALRLDIEDRITLPATGGAPHEGLMPYLAYFGHVMECEAPSPPPREMLALQHRMHPDISRLISKSFYDGRLADADVVRRGHGLKSDWIAPHSGLVWLDTSLFGRDAWEDNERRRNQLEARLIAFVANRLAPFPQHERRIPAVAILSPYLKQLELLKQKSISESIPREAFHSVDSFQGREAEIVLVSLVRFNSFEAVTQGLGFLAEPERVNVMLSRARRLLVIVGALKHFERFAGSYWGTLAGLFRERPGLVVDPRSIGFAAREAR